MFMASHTPNSQLRCQAMRDALGCWYPSSWIYLAVHTTVLGSNGRGSWTLRRKRVRVVILTSVSTSRRVGHWSYLPIMIASLDRFLVAGGNAPYIVCSQYLLTMFGSGRFLRAHAGCGPVAMSGYALFSWMSSF